MDDGFWIIELEGYVGQSLLALLNVIGLIWSLLWLRDARLSASLSATAFAVQLTIQLSGLAWSVFATGWTFYTSPANQSGNSLWPYIALSAFWSLGSVCSWALLLAAIVIAWRRHLLYVRLES